MSVAFWLNPDTGGEVMQQVRQRSSDRHDYVLDKSKAHPDGDFVDAVFDLITEMVETAYELGHQHNRDIVRKSLGLDNKTNIELSEMFSEWTPFDR